MLQQKLKSIRNKRREEREEEERKREKERKKEKNNTFIVLVEVHDALGFHVGVLHLLPRDGEDEIGLVVDLRPVGVEEGDRLLREGLLADHVEVVERLLVELLSEGFRVSHVQDCLDKRKREKEREKRKKTKNLTII